MMQTIYRNALLPENASAQTVFHSRLDVAVPQARQKNAGDLCNWLQRVPEVEVVYSCLNMLRKFI